MTKEDDYILIIDDSTTNQVLMEALLQEEGFNVQSASNAAEAYSIIQRRKPKLILLDLLMPQVSGIECLKQFKSNESTVDIPVIVVSAVNSAEYKEACSKLGALDYYTKPIEISKFIQRVGQMLTNKY
ncbi:MAG: response regulator [Bacteroidales bacterium]|nr:MAG: response regulator [Bacteroidales bacterium]